MSTGGVRIGSTSSTSVRIEPSGATPSAMKSTSSPVKSGGTCAQMLAVPSLATVGVPSSSTDTTGPAAAWAEASSSRFFTSASAVGCWSADPLVVNTAKRTDEFGAKPDASSVTPSPGRIVMLPEPRLLCSALAALRSGGHVGVGGNDGRAAVVADTAAESLPCRPLATTSTV
ncbi:hypothetical protein GCM10020218_055820 [Dactylosporangium vinaceum]